MVKFIGVSDDEVTHGTFDEFVSWESSLLEYQLDVETNVVDELPQRKLITIQFGDIKGKDQWVLQVSHLTASQARKVKEILENDRKTKLIHAANFEYTILLLYGIKIENVYDTMLAEMILTTGIDTPEGYHGLAQTTKRYLFKDVSKAEQTTFGDNILTKAKIEYAAEDVTNLGKIRIQQIDRIKHERLETVLSLENEVVLAFGDISFNGMKLDVPKWKENIAIAEPIIRDVQNQLETILRTELKEACLNLGFLVPSDTLEINWNSSNHRKIIFSWLVPDLEITTQYEMKKYLKTTSNEILEAYLNKDYNYIEQILLRDHREDLINYALLLPEGTLTLNWNSPQQRLQLFQAIAPEMQGTAKEDINKVAYKHPLFRIYQKYINSTKLITSYGETFIDLLDSDGKIRPHFKQILSTGRVSCNKKMQTIPAKEEVGNAYRNCFMADEGHVFVDSDYSSQELCVIAEMSQDPVWIKALENGEDLHSICAELVFGDKWKEGAEDDCAYYKIKDKCKCKKHKTMRTAVKTINFGLAYGMSKYKLAATLQISIDEAAQLIEDYFKAFPSIGGLLTALGRFGVINGYIMTKSPFFRKRYYKKWKKYKRHIPQHLNGRKYHAELGSIERQSKNQPIQGCSGDMMKLAMIKTRWYINDNNLRDVIKLVMQVHDQLTTTCKEEIAEEWKIKLTELMEEAGKICLPSGLLKAETNITQRWSK